MEKKHETKLNFNGAVKEESIFWSHRSKNLWLKFSDKCLKPFPQIINKGGAASSLKYLLIGGSTYEDKGRIINQHAVEYFKDLYKEPVDDRPFCDSLNLSRLSVTTAIV